MSLRKLTLIDSFFLRAINQGEILEAEIFLKRAAQQNIAEFLKALSAVLVSSSCSVIARIAAGIQLKNQLINEQNGLWFSFDDATRKFIKQNVSIFFEIFR